MNIFEPTNFVVYAELIYGNMKLFLKPTSFLAMMLCYWKLLKIIKIAFIHYNSFTAKPP